MIKVCMLTSEHSPLDARIFYKEAMSLKKNGFSVTIIAPVSDHGFFTDAAGNEILKTNDNLTFIHKGIKLRGYRIRKSSLPKLCFFINLRRAAEAIAKVGIEEHADVYHCHELPSLLAGVKIKEKMNSLGKKIHLIFDAHEYWPGVYEQRYKKIRFLSIIVRHYISYIEQKMARSCDFIITANQIVRGYFVLRNQFIRTAVLYNYPLLDLFKDTAVKKDPRFFVLCHEGSLPFNRGLKTMIYVIKKLKEAGRAVKLLIVGDAFGAEKKWLDESIAEYDLHDDIFQTGWLPYEAVGENIAKADIGLILMESITNNMLGGPPNKLFNYMRYGLPVLASDFPEIRRVIMTNDCGLLVDARDVKQICEKICYLLDNPEERTKMGKKAKKAVLDTCNWGNMETDLVKIYTELIS